MGGMLEGGMNGGHCAIVAWAITDPNMERSVCYDLNQDVVFGLYVLERLWGVMIGRALMLG